MIKDIPIACCYFKAGPENKLKGMCLFSDVVFYQTAIQSLFLHSKMTELIALDPNVWSYPFIAHGGLSSG